MTVIVDLTVSCTIEDPFLLMRQARDEVDRIKPPDDRERYYPTSLSEAAMQQVRVAIANALLANPAVTLHEISHRVKDMDPLMNSQQT